MKNRIVLLSVAILGILFSIGVNRFFDFNDDSIVDDLKCYFQEGEVKLYKDGNDIYAFIPSGLDFNEVKIICQDNSASINDVVVNSGDSLSDLGVVAGDTCYLSYGRHHYKFTALQSENVSSLFISNATDDFTEVLNDKDHREPIRFDLLDENGNHTYGDLGEIRGHGNTTWKLDKKPFNLYLDHEASLLGLPASDKFCLLANGYDKTNIRNKLIYDFAKEIEPNWTPGCDYVDLYVNGEYYGLYLLSESVAVEANKIDISPESGYWYSMSIPGRIHLLGNEYMVTDDERIVEVKYSPNSDYSVLLSHINEFEKELKNGEGQEMIDLDSWTRKYLIEEIFANTDICSLYFYWDSSNADNKIYAGPHWDYDNALGNTACNGYKLDPTAQIGNQLARFTTYGNAWISELMQSADFEAAVKERYKNEYRSIIDDVATNRIDDLAARIEKASYSNSIRWKKMFDGFKNNSTPQEIKQFLTERVEFLDSLWIDGDTWYSVKVNRGSARSYLFYSIPVGDMVGELPSAESMGTPAIAYWIDEDTGETVSPDEIVNSDRNLKAVFQSELNKSNSQVRRLLTKTNLIYFMIFFLFATGLVSLVIMDRRRHIWKTNTDMSINTL